ncbi:MAG TPA: cytochrome c biogenesis protein ResB, partial [Dehalococcoidia bacterium]|nr:cytochrome c biogenesis protein ResB [Dehalococcoidia bacterium]
IVDDASARFADDGQALDFRSAVRVTSGGDEIAAGDVTVNGPLTFEGWRVHQAAYYENGAALQVRDVRDGLVVYSETLMLDDQIFGPRVTIAAAASGEIISEEVVPPAFAIPDLQDSGYQLVPLAPGVSLALILVSTPDNQVQFHYAVVPVGADDAQTGELDAVALHIDEAPPVAPLVRLYEVGSAEPFAETLVPLAVRDDLPDARIGAIPLDGEVTLSVGFRERESQEGESARQFFYFLGGESPINGLLAPGERVVVADVELEYVSQGLDQSQWGQLIVGETQRIGSVDLTYQGAESVFFRTEPRVPGAEGDALILVERFGQGRTTSTFEARGGESVDLTYSAGQSEAGADSAPASPVEEIRSARLGLGLGGAVPRVDLELGESVVIGNYEYTFLGPREFTGLTVRKDPGAWIFWGAIVAGLAGLLITFFVPRRRIWAKITPERTYLAGLAGHGVNLRRSMGHLARAVGSPDAPPEEDEDE